MRLLVVNPNTGEAMTVVIAEAAKQQPSLPKLSA